jgi:SAM-dependent methyltransferase
MLSVIQELCVGRVCEIGCGTGRCCEAFEPDRYVGLDINDHAVREAKCRYPRHTFKTIDWRDVYPPADTYLFYTVLLHVPDDDVMNTIARTRSRNGAGNRLVVFETMSRELRCAKRGNYQRNAHEYIQMMRRLGRKLVKFRRMESNVSPGFTNCLVVE